MLNEKKIPRLYLHTRDFYPSYKFQVEPQRILSAELSQDTGYFMKDCHLIYVGSFAVCINIKERSPTCMPLPTN